MPNTILICRHNKNGTGYCEHIGSYCVEGPCTAEELIEYAPVRHGRWIPRGDDDSDAGMYKCSECGDERYFGEEVWTSEEAATYARYCPNCGAKMDKEE